MKKDGKDAEKTDGQSEKAESRADADVSAGKTEKAEHKDQVKEKVLQITESELRAYEDQIRDNKDTAQRVMAEFDNFKKRCEKEKDNYCRYSAAETIAKMLPVVDSFDQAARNGKMDEGLGLIRSQFMSILEKEGLRPIPCEGKADPTYHDILLQVVSDKPEGTILEELQRGYMFKDRVLRHSKVKVAKEDDSHE